MEVPEVAQVKRSKGFTSVRTFGTIFALEMFLNNGLKYTLPERTADLVGRAWFVFLVLLVMLVVWDIIREAETDAAFEKAQNTSGGDDVSW